jgi:hypothetical protein
MTGAGFQRPRPERRNKPFEVSNIYYQSEGRAVVAFVTAARYTRAMQLHVARLCLDCEDIHDQQSCPVCSSESFAYLSRWIPAPERRLQPRPLPSRETADTYRQLLDGNRETSHASRWVKRGVLGLAAVSMAGWAWRRKAATGGKAILPDEARGA